MKLSLTLALAIACGASGCSKIMEGLDQASRHIAVLTSSSPQEAPQEIRHPVIELKDGRLTYEGKELKFGTSVKEWQRIIGSPCRKEGQYTGVCAWDALGIHVHEHPKTDNVKTFSITLQDRGQISKSYPSHIFSGQIIIEGTILQAGMSMGEYHTNAKGASYFHCSKGISVCSLNLIDPSPMMIYLGVFDRRDSTPIQGIEFSRRAAP